MSEKPIRTDEGKYFAIIQGKLEELDSLPDCNDHVVGFKLVQFPNGDQAPCMICTSCGLIQRGSSIEEYISGDVNLAAQGDSKK